MAPKKGNKSSKNVSRAASGTATPVAQEPQAPLAPAILGLSFGNSFSSIAVINKEGLADCIANDDGERQIATALSFNGEEVYSGVPARIQLVRNAENTILAFRNLLGKTYDEVKDVKQPYNSAPIVDASGSPAFTVSINGTPTTLTAHECAVRFLKVLLSYATDFLGRNITGAVLSVPADFNDIQVAALKKAAEEADIKVLQTITEASAALTAYHSTIVTESDKVPAIDRNAVVLDVGGSSTTVTAVAVRDGLFVPLSSVTDSTLGGDLFDAKLMDWFSKEFTKKTKVPLEASNHRALMKLRLSVEVTKKSLSASASAPCSVESLAEGMDFHGTINRTRFDLLAGAVYTRILAKVEEALKLAKLDPLHVHEVILVGGTTRLPTLTDKLFNIFNEDSTIITNQIDPDEVVAKGAALHSLSLLELYPLDSPKDLEIHSRSLTEPSVTLPSALSKPIGLILEDSKDPHAFDGKVFVTLVPESTPLPLRRIIQLDVPSGATEVLVSISEGSHEIKSEVPPPKKKSGGGFLGFGGKKDEDEESDDEPEEVRTALVKPEKALAGLVVKVDGTPDAKKKVAKVQLTIVVSAQGKGTVEAVQLSKGAAVVSTEF